MDLNPGTVLKSRYRIQQILGQGGMGAVYLAKDEVLNQDVALKVNFSDSKERSTQFIKEAQLLANLRHMNLPRVIDYFILGANEFLVMDYIPGDDLRHLVNQQGPQSIDRVVNWIEQLGSALTYLHNQNPPIIHRDIKPDNIKLTPGGQVVLVDFGIAKAAYSHQATQLGAKAYTPGYAPPEQYGAGHTGPYTDQYALAATCYFLLSGQKPVDSVARVVEKKTVVSLQFYNPAVPAHISAAINKALAINPQQRFASVNEFIKALRGEIAVMPNQGLSTDYNGTVTALPQSQMLTPEQVNNGFATSGTAQNSHYAQPTGGYAPSGTSPNANGYQTAAGSVPAPRAKKSPIKLIAAIGGGIIILGAVIIGSFFIIRSLINPQTPTESPEAISFETTMTAVAAEAMEEETEPSPSPSPTIEPATATIEPTITNTAEPTLSPTPEFTPTPTPQSIGLMAFISNQGGDGNQVWLLEAYRDFNGQYLSAVEQLTFDEGDKSYPAWSPDGTMLVYSAPGNSATEGLNLWTLDITQTDPVPQMITSRRGDEIEAAWSPDGSLIAYDNNGRDDGGRQIYFVNSDGSSDTRVSYDYFERAPTWDPKGDRLSFVLNGNGHLTLFERSSYDNYVEVKNFDRSSFFGRLGEVDQPTYSPDGEYIIYTQLNGSRTNIWMTRAASRGADTYQLTQSNSDSHPSVSPDSQWIAFTSNRDGDLEIYMMDLTGGLLTNLTANSGSTDQMPAWYPYLMTE